MTSWRSEGDEAERVADRVGEDPEPLAAAAQPAGTQLQGRLLASVKVLDENIEVHLLLDVRLRPGRRLEPRRPGERHPGTVRAVADDDEVAIVLDADHAQQLLVEGGQRIGVGAVDHDAVQSSDHAWMLPQPYDRRL